MSDTSVRPLTTRRTLNIIPPAAMSQSLGPLKVVGAVLTLLFAGLSVPAVDRMFFQEHDSGAATAIATPAPAGKPPGPPHSTSGSTSSPTRPAVQRPPPLDTPKSPMAAGDDSLAEAQAEFDSLHARFTAVKASLQQRFVDLGNLPVKPEILALITTTEVDLNTIAADLKKARRAAFDTRIERVRAAIVDLEKR